jgi:hypothetical protein
MQRYWIVGLLLIAAMSHLWARPITEAQTKALPVIRRGNSVTNTPFDQPPLIVISSVFERRTVVVRKRVFDGVGDREPDRPPKLERWDRLGLLVLRVNERLSAEPDLGGRSDFLLRQAAGGNVQLEFGEQYILFIKFAKRLGGLPWLKADAEPPPYEIAVPDAGFEIVGSNIPTGDGPRITALRRSDGVRRKATRRRISADHRPNHA